MAAQAADPGPEKCDQNNSTYPLPNPKRHPTKKRPNPNFSHGTVPRYQEINPTAGLKPVLPRRPATRRTAAATAGVLALVRILPEGQLLLELAAELPVHGDQLLADGHERLARRDRAVGLDAQEDFGYVGVADWK